MGEGSRLDAAAVRTLIEESWKYLLVSVVALGVDTGLNFLLKYATSTPWQLAVAGGFAAGVLVNYVLSVKFVFHEHRLGSRWIEFAGFLAIGIFGLLVKETVTGLFFKIAGLDYKFATFIAVGAAFVFNFGLRRALLFSANARPGPADNHA